MANTRSACWFLIAPLVAAAVGIALPADAAHRARLSHDLADHLTAGSASIDIIVHGTRASLEALAARHNLRVRRFLKSGAVFRVNAGQLDALQRDDAVDHLSEDVRYRSSGDIMTEAIGADQVWAGAGELEALTGAGIGVAVIDSGVDPNHAALRNRIAASVDFTGGDGIDRYGHGTHVAATIAGRAGRLVETQDYRGIAPRAHIINLRVLGADGSGLASNVIEAIDWAIEHRKAYRIRVINLSLGAPVRQSYRDDPVCEAVERAIAAGIVVVAAAGNYGLAPDGRLALASITSPGNTPSALTVGSLDQHGTALRSDDTVFRSSSRGPTMYDLGLKPDVVAPGRVTAAEASGSYLGRTYPQNHVAGAGADGYIQLSGTSISAGVVSGAVALLLEQRPRLSPRDAKAIVQVTSSFMAGSGLVATGAGSLNVLAAVQFADGSTRSAPVTSIAGEDVRRGGLSYRQVQGVPKSKGHKNRENGGRWNQWRIIDGPAADSVVRRTGDTLTWGLRQGDTIVWGFNDTIVWGLNDTIVWGLNDTIVWGLNDTIVWGLNDTIVWGLNDTIVWGLNDTIVWGLNDTIVWGLNDTIVWGLNDTIVWGLSDTIVWGLNESILIGLDRASTRGL